MLADGWEWRGTNKVKKGRKHYIRVDGSQLKYVGFDRGDWIISCPGGMPRFKLAVLTHYDDEIKKMLRARKREIRKQ